MIKTNMDKVEKAVDRFMRAYRVKFPNAPLLQRFTLSINGDNSVDTAGFTRDMRSMAHPIATELGRELVDLKQAISDQFVTWPAKMYPVDLKMTYGFVSTENGSAEVSMTSVSGVPLSPSKPSVQYLNEVVAPLNDLIVAAGAPDHGDTSFLILEPKRGEVLNSNVVATSQYEAFMKFVGITHGPYAIEKFTDPKCETRGILGYITDIKVIENSPADSLDQIANDGPQSDRQETIDQTDPTPPHKLSGAALDQALRTALDCICNLGHGAITGVIELLDDEVAAVFDNAVQAVANEGLPYRAVDIKGPNAHCIAELEEDDLQEYLAACIHQASLPMDVDGADQMAAIVKDKVAFLGSGNARLLYDHIPAAEAASPMRP